MSVAPRLFVGLLFALLLPGRLLWALLYVGGALAWLLRVSVHHPGRRLLAVRTLSAERIFHGESVQVTLQLTNPTRLPIHWLLVREARPHPLALQPLVQVTELGAGATVALRYTLQGKARGRYRLGPARVTLGEPFGLVRFERAFPDALQLTVYPHLWRLPELGLPARLPLGDLPARRRLHEDAAWFKGTRAYAPGDSLRRIHWAATAHTGQLAVKEFRHTVQLPAAVALNLAAADYGARSGWPDAELAVEAAASLAAHLVERKLPVAFLATGSDPDGAPGGLVRLPARQGRAALLAILEVLARLQPGEAPDFAATVAAAGRELPRGGLLCLVTPQETAELARVLSQLAGSGRQVLLLVLRPGGAGPRRGAAYPVYTLHRRPQGELVVQP